MKDSYFIHEIRRNIPRLLSLFDVDQTSRSYGMGDRFHWAWGLIDFNNVAFQGAANGLSRLWVNNMWPYPTKEQSFVARLDAMFTAAERSTSKDGSLDQAFPREGSYALTAFVAFDLLCSIENMSGCLDDALRSKWISTVEPMIRYLVRADETHGMISNHLAGAVAALVRWDLLTEDEDARQKAGQLLDRILAHQSTEGWFLEYEGADPGYQTLCTHYLADVHIKRPDLDLLEPLRKSIQFLWHFAHPDGSFGGLYGSRNTRFYYPSGVLALAGYIPEAAALAAFMGENIAKQRVVNLSAVDEPNLIPFFNSYCWAAALHGKQTGTEVLPVLPAMQTESNRVAYPKAGLVIDGGAGHYTIISTHKGGVVAHFTRDGNAKVDAGVVVKNRAGRLASSQSYNQANVVKLEGQQLSIDSTLVAMPKQLPTPFQFLVLRALGLTLFRSYRAREFIKQILVRLLITSKKEWPLKNRREVTLGPDLVIRDDTKLSAGYQLFGNPGSFVSIHMASQGYWQLQDELRP